MDGEPVKQAAPAAPGTLPVDPPQAGPQQELVARCTDAMLRGDFWETRRAARRLLAQSPLGDEERAFGEQLLKRTDVDPVALCVGLASFVLFFVILYFTLWR